MIAIRVLREGVAVREVLFRSTPIRIGRSAESDMVLTEPSVSREHARIERDGSGGLMIVAGAGTNGLYAGPRRVDSEPVVGRLRARLGLADIEIEEVRDDPTQPVEDLHGLDQRRTPLTWAMYVAVALIALNLEAVMAAEFWSPWNSQRAVGVIWQSGSMLVAVLVLGSILLGLLKAAGRKVRMADVLRHFAVYSWLVPLATAVSLAAYYVLSDGAGAVLRDWLPALATVAFLAQAAAIRRPPPNRNFRLFWAAAVLLVFLGVEFTGAYAARRMGQPAADHTMQPPAPGFGPGPAVDFEAYAAAVEAAGNRSAEQAR
jgi:FHA domain